MGVREGRALGCSVRVVTTDPGALDHAQRAVDGVLAAIDEAASRFRPDSELSRVNAADGAPRAVSPLLARAVDTALRAAELTGGLVDPTVGRALRLSGYDRDFDALPAAGAPLPLRAETVPGWRSVRFDARRRTLAVPAGVELDLGATAKALAADLAAAAAREAAGCGVLVSLGGDLATAGAAPDGGWRIHVAEDSGHPWSPGEEVIAISEGAAATSSTTVRTWRRGGVDVHHVVDPRTGRAASGPWRTATVLAASCVDANIASTAAIVLGEAALPWLAETGLPARLVGHDGALARSGAWPEPAP